MASFHYECVTFKQDTFIKSIWNSIARECYFTNNSRLKQQFSKIFYKKLSFCDDDKVPSFCCAKRYICKNIYINASLRMVMHIAYSYILFFMRMTQHLQYFWLYIRAIEEHFHSNGFKAGKSIFEKSWHWKVKFLIEIFELKLTNEVLNLNCA